MKTFSRITLLLLITLALSAISFGDSSTHHGRSEYVVVVSGSVTPTERQAAKLLVEAGIGELGRGGREGLGTIYVGPSLASMTLVGNRGSGGRVDWGSLGADGVVVWKADNSDIVLAGGRPRGTAHAVVMFLEEQGGWRWWPDGTRGCSMIRAWIRSGVNHCS